MESQNVSLAALKQIGLSFEAPREGCNRIFPNVQLQ